MVSDRLWGGLDLGQDQVSVCVTDSLGEIVLERDVEATPALVFAAFNDIPRDKLESIGVEAGVGGYLVRKLRALGLPIAALEARKASKVLALRRHKTDTNDARGLADIVRLGGPAVTRVHEKSEESRRIRMHLVLRQQLIKQRVASEHLIRNLLREHGARAKAVYYASKLRPTIEAALTDLRVREGVDLSDEIMPLLNVCQSMRQYQESLDKRLLATARGHPVCRRFLDVPGVGPIAALSFFSAVDDPHRFTRTEDVACFLGLTPKIRESGKYMGRARISKMGSALTRMHLTRAAESLIVVCRQESTLRAQALELRQRLGFRKARIAVARKLSIVLLTLWKTGGTFQAEPSRNIS